MTKRLIVILVALMACFVGGARAQDERRQPDLASHFERRAFPPYGNIGEARKQLAAELASQVQAIDQVCKLTEAQKQKLLLAGAGDIKRFFDRFDSAKQRLQSVEDPAQAPQWIEEAATVWRMRLQSGLFHGDSLFHKVLPNTLTSDQFARYDLIARERRAARHQVVIEVVWNRLQAALGLREARRREFTALLANETKLPPAAQSDLLCVDCILVQLSRLPAAKLRPLFDEAQWNEWDRRVVAPMKDNEPRLKEAGLLVDEDAGADTAEAQPAAPRLANSPR